jgi:hypothetical protein
MVQDSFREVELLGKASSVLAFLLFSLVAIIGCTHPSVAAKEKTL